MNTAPPVSLGVVPMGLARGQLIPFLGAGASAFASQTSNKVPLGAELAIELANMAGFPNDTPHVKSDLARVTSYLAATVGRDWVVDLLDDKFSQVTNPSALHALLSLVATHRPLLIITTNYDCLMERALEAHHVEHDVLVVAVETQTWAGAVFQRAHGADGFTPVDPREISIPIASDNPTKLTRTILLKMHGSVRAGGMEPSFVVTEEDYVAYMSGMTGAAGLVPPCLRTLMRPRRFLFLGYALRDWNLRVLLHGLERASPGGATGGDKRSFAIARSMPPDEQTLWDRRRVTVNLMDFAQFVPQLHGELRTLIPELPETLEPAAVPPV